MKARVAHVTPLVAALLLTFPGFPAHAADSVPPAPAPVVLAPVPVRGSTAPVPSTAALEALVKSAIPKSIARGAGIVVADPASGTVLLDQRGDAPRIPASTIKLLTAAAALTTLDLDATLATRVVVEDSTITLIGGGDTTLGRSRPAIVGGATLTRLARQVATQVGDAPVSLAFDASLFTGPATAPGWPSGMAPVAALSLDGDLGRNPSKRAAAAFAAELRKAGVTVTLVGRGSAPTSATEIARVESPPISVLVEHMLTSSDNVLAESLAHLVGAEVSGTASFESGAKATESAIRKLGIALGTGARIVDGSGLSSRDAIAPAALTDLLAKVATGSDPRLAPIASGMPVAGATGTLADRYTSASQQRAAGYVRAKTGTLRNVVALAGTVEDVDGRVLVFAVLANDVTSVARARRAVDEFASQLFECGCRS